MLRTSCDGVDGGAEAIAKQRGFTLVRPDEGWFPGLEKLREELAGHQWIFGKTPKFKVNMYTTGSHSSHQRLIRRFDICIFPYFIRDELNATYTAPSKVEAV